MNKPLTVTEKILAAHRVNGETEAGELALRIDQTLTQDATGTMAYLQFESMGLSRIKNDLAVSYVDHNTVQIGFENSDDHDFLSSIAKKYGIIYSKAGNGVCHQLHLERFGKPGTTLLGSDSHTPTGGGIGQIAIGAGGIDVAVAMAGGAFHIPAPKIRGIELRGRLRPGVSAKDVILKVLSKFGTKGNVGWIFEYFGEGVAALDVPSRATITNMGAELGVTTSVFPSDETTRRFLVSQKRAKDFKKIVADKGAKYDDVYTVDLDKLEPLAAAPHSPGNVVTVKSMKGTKVNQIMIGSCTNSSYRDIRAVATILKGKHVAEDVEVGIACGSRQVFRALAEDGSLATLIAAGCRILENACGFCIGAHMSPSTNAVSLRTNNRNFEGRSGTKSALVYLVSPETAAASALTGYFTSACELKRVKELSGNDLLGREERSKKSERRDTAYSPWDPEELLFVRSHALPIDDSLFLYRSTARKGVKGTKIIRGPNIAPVPVGSPLPADLKGIAAIKVGDKITTDHIMPAGARLKFRSNVPEYAKYVFEPCDKTFPARCLANKAKKLASFIIAGESYGQGSSREHAALCPMYLGVKAVVAKSIERIHRANLINFGIVPFVFVNSADYNRISTGDKLEIRGIAKSISTDGAATLLAGKTRIPVKVVLSERERKILLAGGLLNSLGK